MSGTDFEKRHNELRVGIFRLRIIRSLERVYNKLKRERETFVSIDFECWKNATCDGYPLKLEVHFNVNCRASFSYKHPYACGLYKGIKISDFLDGNQVTLDGLMEKCLLDINDNLPDKFFLLHSAGVQIVNDSHVNAVISFGFKE